MLIKWYSSCQSVSRCFIGVFHFYRVRQGGASRNKIGSEWSRMKQCAAIKYHQELMRKNRDQVIDAPPNERVWSRCWWFEFGSLTSSNHHEPFVALNSCYVYYLNLMKHWIDHHWASLSYLPISLTANQSPDSFNAWHSSIGRNNDPEWIAQLAESVWNRRVQFIDKNLFPMSSEWVSERTNEWAERSTRAKQAVWSKRMSERCEWMRQRRSEWPQR